MNNNQAVVFTVGKSLYGIPVRDTQEIIKLLHITRIPQSPEYLEGVINLRNCAIPVINLMTYFGVEKEKKEERIIIINVDSQRMGILVGEVEDVIEFPPNAITTLSSVISARDGSFVSGIANLGDRLLILLDTDCLIKLNRTDGIQEFISQEASSFNESGVV